MSTRGRHPAPIDVHSHVIKIQVKRHIYMETGLLDMLNIAPLNENTYEPANLIHNVDDAAGPYNGDMAFFIGDDGLPEEPIDLEDRNDSTDNDGRSKSGVGCDLEEQEDPKDNDFRTGLSIYNPLTDTTSHFGPPNGPWCKDILFFRKYCQVRAPASQWTGLMQKFVQAMYGSDRRDYDYDIGLDNQTIYMPEEPLGFSPFWEATAGIFTDGDYNYWLIRPQSNGVFARLLRPVTGAGKALQKRLQENGDPDREEYYLLTTLRQSERVVQIGDASLAYNFGVPWHWGWHYNEDGSQADVICINPFSNGSLSNPRHESAHYRMTISYTPPAGAEDGPIDEDNQEVWFAGLEATVSQVEAPQEFTHRNNGDLVWWPLIGIDGSETFVPKPLGVGDDIDCDVPMYCFHDQNWILQVVRFSRATDEAPYVFDERSTINGGTATTDPDEPLQFSTGCLGVYGYALKETSDNARVLVGFYIDGGQDARTSEIEGLNTFGSEGFILGGGAQGNWASAVHAHSLHTACWGSPPYVGSFDEAAPEYYPSSGGQLGTTADLIVDGVLAIPWGDASSVYIGHWRRWAGVPVGGGILDGTSTLLKGVHASQRYRNSTTLEEFGGGQTTRFNVVWDRGFERSLGGTFRVDPAIPGSDNLLLTSGTIDFDAIEVWWAHRAGVERVHESASGNNTVTNLYIPSKSLLAPSDVGAGTSGLDPTFDWNGWDEFFNPPLLLVNPRSTDLIPALQSQRGSYFAHTSPEGGTPITNGYDFEPISNTFSFVGEA